MTDCKNGCDLQGNRSHDVGGIDTIVENINKNIEVESQEIIICKKALEDNNVYTYEGSHKQILNKMNKRYGKPLKVITNKDNVITVETGQVVINKRAVNSNVKKRYTGTNREILDKINTSTGGKSIMKHGGFVDSVLQNGGMILNGVTKLQSLLLSKSNFKNKHQADNWVRSHGFTSKVSDETEKYYRYRVNDPKEFKKFSFRTIILKNSGVKAIIGIYKDVNDKGSDINKKSIRNQINIREKEIEHELKINKGVLDDRIKLQKAIDSDKKLKELKGMLAEKMGKGGSVEPLFDLDFYQVTQSSERDSDYLYQGIDFDDAKSEYDYASEQDEDTYVILEKYTNKYKFVYELDAENEETIEDYPIEDYYNDSDYYKLVENGLDNDTEILESKELKRIKSNKENIEEEFLQLHSDFIESFEDNYKNKIHLQEYAGLMGRSKYYYLLLDANSDLIDFDKDNILLYLEKKDSTFDDRIVRNFVNVNKENAVLCVRISDHNKVYKTYGDACLSIVFDKKSDRIELQDTDGENENIVELTYGIEKYFENYSISEIFDVEYSVDSFIKDLDYNSLIDGRESEEYKKGGEIQTKTEESKKQFMIDFINWYKKNVHEKMNIFVSINKSKDCVYIDMFEKIDQNVDAKPYLQYLCDLADKYNVNIRLEPVPRYKFFLKNTEKRKKITKDYLIQYYKKFGFMEEGSEMIRESKNTPFTQLCNVFKSEMERDYGFKFIENTDNFNSKYGNGHVEFTMEKDDKYATAFIYFEGKREFPIIFGFDEKGNYYADYSTFETILKLIKRKEFKDGGAIYEGKREFAAKRMAENKKIETLTESQHEAMSNLASVRHDFHVNMEKITKSDDNKLKPKLIEANIQLKESGLMPMSFLPTDEEDFIDIDSIDELYEIDEVPEDEDERKDWYDENYESIFKKLSNLHSKIEDYMRSIDKQYGTNYAPSGMSRMFKDGGTIQKSRMEDFINAFYRDIEQNYNIEIKKQYDTFSMFGQYGHFEFLIPSDKMEGEILMYFKVLANRSMTDFINTKGDVIVTPVIKCYIDKDYNITFDYSELDKYLQQCGVEKFKDGGEVKKKVSRRNLPLNTTYKIIDSFYTGGLSENPHFCENCGKPIANVGIVENEKGEHFEVGMDCAKTLSGIDDDLKFSDAEDDFKKANQIRQKINKAKKNDSLKINTEITYFKGDVVIEVVNKNNDRYEYRIASEPQDFIEKYMPDVLKMISNKEKLGYKPKYTKIFGFDFSKIQRKGNDFEYSFDNVRFKVYDLEIKSDSGIVNSHIAYDVYVDDKLIGSDTTYNQRDLEIYILGILNKYYFEKYSNMQSISQKHNIPESEIKEAKKIESEHIDTLEQVYDHKLTPKEAVDKIVSDHIEESPNYYDSEVGLPAMEEKLKNIKRASKYSNEELTELCKQADINKETLVFDVPDDRVEFFKSLGFVVKE